MDKAPGAFRTISEVADEIDVPQHVLRFWESRFPQIRPMKRGGGRRYYRPDDVDLLRGVRHLLYGQGYTIRGVQRILREQGVAFVQDVWRAGAALPADPQDDSAGDEAMSDAASGERLEPSLFGPGAERHGPKMEGSPLITRQPLGMADHDRKKLQSALDELGACRRLIDEALAQD